MHAVVRIRKIARELLAYADKEALIGEIKNSYDITVSPDTDSAIVEVLHKSLKRLPPDLVRDCGIRNLGFEDLGPSKEYYPNHGKYHDNVLTLNHRIIEDPTVIEDEESKSSVNKFDQTLYHELGHGWDEVQSDDSEMLSLKDAWMSLSNWSKDPVPGYKRIRICEKGTPEIVGEYYYGPDAEFTRFYAKRNPWDDWADSFSYYVAGLKSYLPEEKIKYFDDKLGKYFKG